VSEFTEAFAELREEGNRASGEIGEVRIDGKRFPAIVKDLSFEDIVANDGNGEAGGFRALVSLADHPKKPNQGATIEGRGQEVSILSVEKKRSCWIIIAGDTAVE
jgi:hypothetical protein